MRYQHVVPQEAVHAIKPTLVKARRGYTVICATCSLPIKTVDEAEGPESLKALLRL